MHTAIVNEYVLIDMSIKTPDNESQGQEEAAWVHQAYVTTSALFTDTNVVKIASAVTW